MVFGVVWLLCRRQRQSAAWVGVPTTLIFLVGSTPLVDAIVAQAERPQAQAGLEHLPEADVVVVLGGYSSPSKNDPLGFTLNSSGSRLLTALELVRRGTAKALVLGGSGPLPDNAGEASSVLVQQWILGAGLGNFAVTNLGLCANTHDEAVRFKVLSAERGWQTVLLATSALHMPRSVATFTAQGIAVVPVACDFQVCGVPPTPGGFSPFPRQDRFRLFSVYLHEKIGWLAYRWRGWI